MKKNEKINTLLDLKINGNPDLTVQRIYKQLKKLDFVSLMQQSVSEIYTSKNEEWGQVLYKLFQTLKPEFDIFAAKLMISHIPSLIFLLISNLSGKNKEIQELKQPIGLFILTIIREQMITLKNKKIAGLNKFLGVIGSSELNSFFEVSPSEHLKLNVAKSREDQKKLVEDCFQVLCQNLELLEPQGINQFLVLTASIAGLGPNLQDIIDEALEVVLRSEKKLPLILTEEALKWITLVFYILLSLYSKSKYLKPAFITWKEYCFTLNSQQTIALVHAVDGLLNDKELSFV